MDEKNLSGAFGVERDVRQALEMGVAGQEFGTLMACCRIDNRVSGGKPVFAVKIRSQQRDRGVQRNDHTLLRVGDDPVGLIFTQLAIQPFRQLQLHDGRYDAMLFIRESIAVSQEYCRFNTMPVFVSLHVWSTGQKNPCIAGRPGVRAA